MAGDPERPDNPNQQVVRPDGSGPADEGTGGGEAPPPTAEPKKAPAKKAATKDETEDEDATKEG